MSGNTERQKLSRVVKKKSDRHIDALLDPEGWLWRKDEKNVFPLFYSGKYTICVATAKVRQMAFLPARTTTLVPPVQRVNRPFSQRALNPGTSPRVCYTSPVTWLDICLSRLHPHRVLSHDQGPLSDTHLSCATTVLVLAEYCKYLNEVLWELLQRCRLCVQRHHVFTPVFILETSPPMWEHCGAIQRRQATRSNELCYVAGILFVAFAELRRVQLRSVVFTLQQIENVACNNKTLQLPHMWSFTALLSRFWQKKLFIHTSGQIMQLFSCCILPA